MAAVGGLAGGLLVLAGVAFACTPQAMIQVSAPSAPAGETITVTGNDFQAAPVSIHLTSASGPVLGTAQGPQFSTPITVPDASVGIHYLVATQSGSSNPVVTLEIVDKASPSSPAVAVPAATSPAATGPAAAQPSVFEPVSPVDAPASQPAQAVQAVPAPERAASTPQTRPAAPARSAPAPAFRSQQVPAAAPVTEGGPEVASTTPPAANAEPQQPASLLWSGSGAESSATGGSFAAGVAFLMLGAVSLVVAMGVAVVHRQRALVTSEQIRRP